MTKFNPENKEVLTYGECLHPPMKIEERADADQYFKDYVAYIQKHLDIEPRKDALTAEQIAKINLGYFAGYYDHETRKRVERLFKCSHPVFGSAERRIPTPQEALEAGLREGKKFISHEGGMVSAPGSTGTMGEAGSIPDVRRENH